MWRVRTLCTSANFITNIPYTFSRTVKMTSHARVILSRFGDRPDFVESISIARELKSSTELSKTKKIGLNKHSMVI